MHKNEISINSIVKNLIQQGEKETVKILTALARLPKIILISDSTTSAIKNQFLEANFSVRIESDKNNFSIPKLTSEDLILVANPTHLFLAEIAKTTAAQLFIMTKDPHPEYDETLHDGQFHQNDFENHLKKIEILWPEIKEAMKSEQNDPEDLRPALFLDRDGVVIEHVDYINSPGDVKLKEGISDLINEAHKRSWVVVLITNQSGVGRGYFKWKDFDAVQLRMMQLLAQNGAWIDRVVVAGYHESSKSYDGHRYPHFRKPRSSMIMSVIQDLRIDLQNSWMLGDRTLDIRTGYNAGVKNLVLMTSKKDEIEESPLRTKDNKKIIFKIIESLKELGLFSLK